MFVKINLWEKRSKILDLKTKLKPLLECKKSTELKRKLHKKIYKKYEKVSHIQYSL